MSSDQVEKIANAVLYEGYLLYPYRRSSIKNQQRFNFGVIYPQSYGNAHDELCLMQTECLATGGVRMSIDARVRFLRLIGREGWQEAVECEERATGLPVAELLAGPHAVEFIVPAQSTAEPADPKPIHGKIEFSARQVGDGTYMITTRVLNLTPLNGAERSNRDEALPYSMVSTHCIFQVTGGEFLSLLDPPESMRGWAAACRNLGTFPVLVGAEGSRDTVLSSPIILYDYPEIAPESSGDLFDGTEIDEILTLRILTLTEEEKQEMRNQDQRAKQILERVESLSAEQLMKLHGVIRDLRS
jgi:hydrogenase maturation protease